MANTDLTSMRGGVSVVTMGQVYHPQKGYCDVVELAEVLDVLIAKVKELTDERS
jgi:hypothetical protein